MNHTPGRYSNIVVAILIVLGFGALVVDKMQKNVYEQVERECNEEFGKGNWILLNETDRIRCQNLETKQVHTPELTAKG